MKILVVLSRLPYPLDKGDKLRAFYQIKELNKTNEVYLFCLNNNSVSSEAKQVLESITTGYCIAQFNKIDTLFGVATSFFDFTPLETGYFTSRKNIAKLKAYATQIKPDILFYQFVRTAKYALKSYPKVLDYQDALSANMSRRATKTSGIKKLFYLIEAKRLKKYETEMFNLFDHLTIIVDADRKEIDSPRQEEIIILPNGVDNAFFDYPQAKEKRFDVIFSGGMSYSPNVIAASYLVKDIMPLVWKELPNTRVVIAGANPTSSVKALAADKVTVTGWVDDMKEYYASSKVFIAPMQIGTGLQNKLLEAMAMHLPCITSSLANSALGAKTDEELLIANTAQENASQILRLLKDTSLADKISKAGNAFVSQNYRWETYGRQLSQILSSCIK